MSNYKYGDWYCKPANESEAREIIERAVVSGAVNPTGWIGDSWDYCSYGVADGQVYPYGKDETSNATEYTIEQVRDLFPLPGEQQAKWNGEGVPPAGTVCEARLRGEWHQCEVLKNKINTAGTKVAACDFGFTLAWCADFRPLRTERERWIDAAARIPKPCGFALVPIMEQIYDAIKSGTLPAPEV